VFLKDRRVDGQTLRRPCLTAPAPQGTAHSCAGISRHEEGDESSLTGNAADKFVEIDRYVAWRLKRLMIKRKGRNLRAGEAARWTPAWLKGMGLHQLMGTIRYPGAA